MTRRSLSTAYKVGSLVRRRQGKTGRRREEREAAKRRMRRDRSVRFTSQPSACVDNQRPVGVLLADFPAVVGCEGVDAANVVLRLNTGSAVTKVVGSVSSTGGEGGEGRGP